MALDSLAADEGRQPQVPGMWAVARMTNKPKRIGTAWESAIITYLKEHGVLHAERRTLAGSGDRGDIAGIPGVVIEAKNVARMDLSGWLDEAEKERANDGAEFGVVWHKKKGKTSPGAAYVTMDGSSFVRLLGLAGFIPEQEESHGEDHRDT